MVEVTEDSLVSLTCSPPLAGLSWTAKVRGFPVMYFVMFPQVLRSRLISSGTRAKVTVPEVRKTVDCILKAKKAYLQACNCEVPVLTAAQTKFEQALDWIPPGGKVVQAGTDLP
jgi:hypothetical protein